MKFLVNYDELIKNGKVNIVIKNIMMLKNDINKFYVLIEVKKITNIYEQRKIASKYEEKLSKLNLSFDRVIVSNNADINDIMDRNHFDVLLTNKTHQKDELERNEFVDVVSLEGKSEKDVIEEIKKLLEYNYAPIINKQITSSKPSEDKIWLKYYNNKVLRDLKRFSLNKKTTFQQICDYNKDFLYDVAIDYYGVEITYDDFISSVNKFEKSFTKLGVKKNDVVTICAPNVPDSIYAYFAVQNLGAIPSMLHVFSKSDEIKHYLTKEQSKYIVMIGMNETCNNILKVIDETNIKKVVVVPLNASLDMKSLESIKTKLGIKVLTSKFGNFIIDSKKILDNHKKENGKTTDVVQKNILFALLECYINSSSSFKIPMDERFISLDDFLKSGELVDNVTYNYNDIATIIHTGGTTGIGKSTIISQDNINSNDDAFEATIQDFERGDTIITIPPVFHILGLNNCVTLILRNGGKIVLISKYRKKELPKLLKKHNPELVFGVPKIGKDIIETKGFDQVNLSSLKYYVLGGEEMSKEFIDKSSVFLKKHGSKVDISQSLGATEGTCSLTNTFNNCNIHGSIGIPLINLDCKVVKENENGDILEANYGEYGELCFAGDSIMVGYLGDVEETNKTLQKHSDGKTWLHTGDNGYIDENGILYFADRIKDMFKINGEQVFPSEIKKVINKHPVIKECAVVCTEINFQKKVVVAITLKDASYNVTKIKEEVLVLCQKSLRKESIPTYIDVREELPETNLFKINNNELREQYMQEQVNFKTRL